MLVDFIHQVYKRDFIFPSKLFKLSVFFQESGWLEVLTALGG